jgi:hypothetical protein
MKIVIERRKVVDVEIYLYTTTVLGVVDVESTVKGHPL